MAQPLRLRKQRLAAAERCFGAFSIFDVRRRCIPFDHISGFVPQADRANQKPTIFAIDSAEAYLGFIGVAGRQRLIPHFPHFWQIIG